MKRRSLLTAIGAMLTLPLFKEAARATKAPDPRAGLIQYKNRVYGSPRTPEGIPQGRPAWRPSNAKVIDYRNQHLDLSPLKKRRS